MLDEAQLEELTPKARQTREHILTTALALFAERGYGETTLRDIAAEADISLGLTYRYFARKEELILALYRRLAQDLADEVQQMPAVPIAQRYAAAFGSCLTRLTPHREALGALFAVGLAPDSEMAVLGDRAAGVRDTVWHVYLNVVQGASDRPRPRQVEQLATVLYSAHLLCVLFWLQDRSPGQTSTRELVQFAQEMLARLRPVLGLPPVARLLARLTRILDPMFGPARETVTDGAGTEAG
jgi:AcrR family transcriptional regulator